MQHLVKFNDFEIPAVKSDNEVFVAIKPICEAIGIDWAYAIERIKENEILGELYGTYRIVAADGATREMVCLPLDYVAGWLFMINVKLVNEEARPILIKFQRECYKALRDYFFGKPAEQAQTAMRIHQLMERKKALQQEIAAINVEVRRIQTRQLSLPFNQ